MSWEVQFEQMSLALETVRGTIVTPPTIRLNGAGLLVPRKSIFRPDDMVGELAEYQRSETVRKWADFTSDLALDPHKLPFLMNMLLAPLTSPATPPGGTLSRLWAFTRGMTTDVIKSATAYWGDPNQAVLQSPFTMMQSMTWEADASTEEGTTSSLTGFGIFPETLTGGGIPALPAVDIGPVLVPGRMQLWIDTTNPIGTTEITGRVVRAGGTINSGAVPKYMATGPAGNLSYVTVGRQKTHPELTVTTDMVDMAQYDLFKNGNNVKVRVRVNGPEIETGFYYYFEQDIYGEMDSMDWSDLEETNRTFEFTILGEKDPTLGSDTRVAIQNTKTAL